VKRLQIYNGYISDLEKVWALQLFYTYFYNHAHRPRLEKLLYIELSRSSNGFLNHFWIQMTVLLLKPPIETAKNLPAIYLTEIPQRTQVSVRV
jgi:hypothetical protein